MSDKGLRVSRSAA